MSAAQAAKKLSCVANDYQQHIASQGLLDARLDGTRNARFGQLAPNGAGAGSTEVLP